MSLLLKCFAQCSDCCSSVAFSFEGESGCENVDVESEVRVSCTCWKLCMCGFLFCSFCNEGALMELSSGL